MSADDDLHELAARQLGFVTRLDARSAGWSTSALRHRVARGDWIAHGRYVLQRAGAPWARGSPLMRAVLDAGAGSVVSHTTAAAWWGLPGFDLRPIHVTRPRGITSHPARYADRLHAVLTLASEQVTVLDGVPIVRPERALFELCGTAHPGRAERALDAAWSRGLCSGASLRRVHRQLAESGRAGTVVMRELLEARPPGWVPPASNLEARFMSIARDAGLGEFRRQVDVGDGSWCGRVDFLAVAVPLVVEVQSERYHTALTDQAHDTARRAAIESSGFVVLEVWDRQLWHDRQRVVAAVRDAVLRAAANRRAA